MITGILIALGCIIVVLGCVLPLILDVWPIRRKEIKITTCLECKFMKLCHKKADVKTIVKDMTKDQTNEAYKSFAKNCIHVGNYTL